MGHDGGNSSGEFLYSLNATDVASGWVETEALRMAGWKLRPYVIGLRSGPPRPWRG